MAGHSKWHIIQQANGVKDTTRGKSPISCVQKIFNCAKMEVLTPRKACPKDSNDMTEILSQMRWSESDGRHG